MGIKLLNLDLQFMSPEDFIGIPNIVELSTEDIEKMQEGRPANISKAEWEERIRRIYKYGFGATRGNVPLVLPRDNMDNGKGGILFLDEANRASRRVLYSMMNFVQQGRIGDYDLPSKWVIVAAGNRPANDEAQVEVFDFALADRFDLVNYSPLPEDWVKWAKGQASSTDRGWPMEIISYLQKNPEKLHHLDPVELDKAEGMGGKFRTHRSWTTALNAIQNQVSLKGVDSWKDLPFEKVMKIIQDNVGLTGMSEIRTYLETLSKFSDEDIRMMYTNPDKATMIKQKAGLEQILYGLYFVIKREAESEQGENLPIKTLLNIAKYLNRYQQHEIMTALYTKMKMDFPDIDIRRDQAIGDIMKDPTHPEHENAKMKYEIAKMLAGQLEVEGIMKKQNKVSPQT